MENLGWGFQMTVLGMGLVFALLALLWVLLTVVLMLDKEEEEAPAASAAEEASDDDVEPAVEEAEDAVGAQASESQTVDGMAADLIAAVMVAAMKHKLTLRSEAAPMVRTNWPGSQPSRWAVAGRVRQTNTWTPKG